MYKIETDFPLEGFMDSRIGGRDENQDSCGFSDTPLGSLAIVCDGMGGMRGGATASSLAVSEVIETLSSAKAGDDPLIAIRKAVSKANHAVIQKGLEDSSLLGMGTTLTLLLINDDCAYVTHVGDSRVYQLRKGKKVFRTFDDSVVFQLVKAGTLTEEQARLAGNSNIITKALGISEDLDFDIDRLPYDKGDRFLLCTDGFWGTMREKEVLALVGRDGSLELTVERSLSKVEKAGAIAKDGHHDNLTAAVIDIKKYSKYRSKMERLFKIATVILSVLLLASLCYIGALKKAEKKFKDDASVPAMTVVKDSLSKADAAEKSADATGVSKDSLPVRHHGKKPNEKKQ